MVAADRIASEKRNFFRGKSKLRGLGRLVRVNGRHIVDFVRQNYFLTAGQLLRNEAVDAFFLIIWTHK